MTKSQKLAIEISAKQRELSRLSNLDKPTAEDTDNMQDVMTALSDLNTQFNAAKLVEGNEEAEARGAFGNNDGQSAEVRMLMSSVSLTDYLKPAGAGTGISGAAAELNDALGVELTGKNGGVLVPFDMLLNPIQAAFTETSNNDGSEIQRPILQRLFGPGVMDTLGVRMDSVPVGRTEWPLISAGASPAQVKEGTAAAAAAEATFSFASLKPKRLTGRYEFSHEIAASVAQIEEALRRDLGDAVKSKMSDLIISGAAPTKQQPAKCRGLSYQPHHRE